MTESGAKNSRALRARLLTGVGDPGYINGAGVLAIQQHAGRVAGSQDDLPRALQRGLDVEEREERGGDLGGFLDLRERPADDLRANGLRLAEALRGFLVGLGVDDRD